MRKVDEQEEEALKHPEIVFQLQEILKDVRALDLNAKSPKCQTSSSSLTTLFHKSIMGGNLQRDFFPYAF
jgi:hypothetical protein